MRALLDSPTGKIGAGALGGLVVVAALWLLLVSPQRSKAAELDAQLATARAELVSRRAAAAAPSVAVTVRPGDLFRLTKALPDETDMAGIILDVNRLAVKNRLVFNSLKPEGAVTGVGYTQQPVDLVVQGRFADVSRFIHDVRMLVSVRRGQLDARGRLYSVSHVELGAPDGGKDFPVVNASVTLQAYTYAAIPPPAPKPTDPSTTTDSSTDGTVSAAGATP